MSPVTADELRRAGVDVLWSGDWESDPGDPEILARAHAEGRALVTLDKDYGELAVLHGHVHSGIIRLVDIPASQHSSFCLSTIERYGAAIEMGAIVTVEMDRTRVRIEDEEQPDA